MLLVAVAVTATVMAAGSTSAKAEWLPEGWSTEGTIYKNTTNGDIEFWSKEGYVTKMTQGEFESYSKIVEAYGKTMNDPSGVMSTLSSDAVSSTSGLTQAEAEDAANVILKSRAAGAGLDSTVTGGLDLAGADAGVFGSSTIGGAAATAFGAVALGPVAFAGGLFIGEGIDQLFGLPSLELFKSEQVGPEKTAKVLMNGGEGSMAACGGACVYPSPPRGLYLECWESAASVVATGVENSVHSCGNKSGVGTYQAKGEHCYELCTKFTHFTATWMTICLIPSGTSCLVKNVPTTLPNELTKPLVTPLGVPQPGTTEIPEPYKKHDEEAGVGSKPEHKIVTAPLRSTKLTRQQIQEILTYGMAAPASAPSPTEMDKADKNETTPTPTAAPTYNYFSQNSPTQPTETGTTAAPAEPEAPFFTAPNATLKTPNFGAACTAFPFGVPCWAIKLIEKWSGSGSAPSVDIPLAGKTMHVTFSGLEPVMEILRPIFGVALIVGLVMTFFSFAIGGSGGSDD